MKYVTGYEKAWLAFLGAGIVTSVNTALLWTASITGSIASPDEATITAAVTGITASIAAGVLAYLGTTSPIPPDPSATPEQKIAAAAILGSKAGAAAGAAAGAEAAGAVVVGNAAAADAGAVAGAEAGAVDVPKP